MSTAVLFDLDGTLIDSLPNVTDGVNRLLATHDLPALSADTVRGFVGHGERVLLDRLIAATALDLADYDALMTEFMAIYREVALQTRLMPGASKALKAIRELPFALGLVTNKPRAPLLPTLTAAGLDEAFDLVIAGDDLESRKPDPAPLFHAMAKVGADRSVYVGDSEVDAETARRAEVPFVFYTEGIRTKTVNEIPHDVAFNDFANLPGILVEMAG